MFFHLLSLSNKSFCLLVLFALALGLTTTFLPFYIRWLKHLQLGQFIREEGPASHAVKAKTPTTGGVLFILTIAISVILFCFLTKVDNVLPYAVFILALLCAGLGLIDDLAKFRNQANRGLSARSRLLAEMIFGALFGFLLLYILPPSNQILPSLLFVALAIFLIPATANAVNLHDGMDGLAAGTAILIFITLAIMFFYTGNFSLALIASACAGGLCGFLFFNRYPAKIFMGDTGSLFIGGMLAALVLASGLIFWFIPLSLIYIVETLSVIAQVSYFKLSKPYVPPKPMNRLFLSYFKLTHKLPGEGIRLLRMAPLHHHFEAVFADKGIPEWQVVIGFWLVQLSLCLIVLTAFFYS